MSRPEAGPQPGPLIVRLRNWIGDVLLGLPALQLLHDHGYALQLVGKPWAAELLRGQGWVVHTRPETSLRERVAQLRGLKQVAAQADAGFARRDNALVLPYSFSSALEMRLAGLRAVGVRHEARGWLLARSEPFSQRVHIVESFYELACRFLRLPPESAAPAALRYLIDPARANEAREALAAAGLAPGFIVLCPFAGGKSERQDKVWPHFAELARRLHAQGHALVVGAGNAAEAQAAGEQFGGLARCLRLPLNAFAAVLQQARLVIANDTGPAHLAAAVGTPLLGVMGPTKPEQWAPWGPGVHIIKRHPEWPPLEPVLARMQALLQLPSPQRSLVLL